MLAISQNREQPFDLMIGHEVWCGRPFYPIAPPGLGRSLGLVADNRARDGRPRLNIH